MELLVDRKIIFLDEPTSGLDASASLELVTILKRVSRKVHARGGSRMYALETAWRSRASRAFKMSPSIRFLSFPFFSGHTTAALHRCDVLYGLYDNI